VPSFGKDGVIDLKEHAIRGTGAPIVQAFDVRTGKRLCAGHQDAGRRG
jgi:hypothetical protein